MMQLQELYDIANLFQSHKTITHIARLHDNIILLKLDSSHYCIDLNRGNPQVYITQNLLKNKFYNAPFDIAMSKYLHKANIQSCKLDGMNKIIFLNCEIKNKYKSTQVCFQLEFINRATNAIILCDNKIISALRFYDNLKRPILPKILLNPMPQPNFYKELKNNDVIHIREQLIQNHHKKENALLLQKRLKIETMLNQKLHKLQKILESLPDIHELEREKEQQFMIANHILTNINSIPNYATHVLINQISYEIPQKQKASLVSNKLFKQVKKLKQKILHINLQKDNLNSKITFLHNLIVFAKTATIQELNMLTQKKCDAKKDRKKHYESFYIDGIRISIGRNEQENIKLLQDAKADFLWLHILNIPSSHLIIHASKVDSQILEHAGTLLARLCGIKDNKITIDYTKRRFVKIIHGANVIYSKESKLHLSL